MFISRKFNFTFSARNNLLNYITHRDQNCSGGVAQKFIPHKSTKYGKFYGF